MDFNDLHLLDFTPEVLLGIGVLALITGKLVARRFLDDAIRQMEYWREAHSNLMKALAEEQAQNNELREHSRLTVQLLQSIRAEADKRGQ